MSKRYPVRLGVRSLLARRHGSSEDPADRARHIPVHFMRLFRRRVSHGRNFAEPVSTAAGTIR